MVGSVTFSTEDLPLGQRRDWLREVIGREYAHVEITPPVNERLFNEMTIYPWSELRLSSIRSNAISIERSRNEPTKISHDAYFAVVLLSGAYRLEQDGREAVLEAGDMAIYDATRPHRIFCPERFSKLIVAIPRPLLKERAPGVERCTALRIPGNVGLGAVTGDFIRTAARRAGTLERNDFAALSNHCADFMALTLSSLWNGAAPPSRNRAMTLSRVKQFAERNLRDPGLTAASVSGGVGLSQRYINDLFKDEGASLMRYIWRRRLENCRRDLLAAARAGDSLSDIAFSWGFNDLSHFSRSFKACFGASPRDYRWRSGER